MPIASTHRITFPAVPPLVGWPVGQKLVRFDERPYPEAVATGAVEIEPGSVRVTYRVTANGVVGFKAMLDPDCTGWSRDYSD